MRDGQNNINKSFCPLGIVDYLEMSRPYINKCFCPVDSKNHIMLRRKKQFGKSHSLHRRLSKMTEEEGTSVRERNRLRTT